MGKKKSVKDMVARIIQMIVRRIKDEKSSQERGEKVGKMGTAGRRTINMPQSPITLHSGSEHPRIGKY